MSPTEGTLQEFDIVFSVSEAALNDQFLVLYRTPVQIPHAPDPLPPAPGEADAPKPDVDHLISHKLAFEVEQGLAISGYIECPRVDMVNLSRDADKTRTVRLRFKFLDNAPGSLGNHDYGIPAYDQKYDSIFTWYVTEAKNAAPTKKKALSLNGYTFSFEACLTRKDIKSMQQIQQSMSISA